MTIFVKGFFRHINLKATRYMKGTLHDVDDNMTLFDLDKYGIFIKGIIFHIQASFACETYRRKVAPTLQFIFFKWVRLYHL